MRSHRPNDDLVHIARLTDGIAASRASANSRQHWEVMAEVDGNRTRRTGVSCPDRFEGGGTHQACGHLHIAP